MAKLVTPSNMVSAWFKEYQNNHVMTNGVIPKWFHGNISRNQAEKMLLTKPPGHFLIRVSESRIGYTLSYRAQDLCRHFMIEILPGNQCGIVGENRRHYSLHDLVAFHRRTPISPYTDLLTEACDQAGEDFSGDSVPSLSAPRRVSYPPTSGVSLSPPRLYPNLERELSALNLDSVSCVFQGYPLKPEPLPRSKFSLVPSEFNTMWKSALGEEQNTGLPTTWHQTNTEAKVHQKCRAAPKQERKSLIQCSKIFKKKKKNLSEEHTYMEINDDYFTTEPAALKIAAMRDQKEVEMVFSCLPTEYLHPPPFAPGY